MPSFEKNFVAAHPDYSGNRMVRVVCKKCGNRLYDGLHSLGSSVMDTDGNFRWHGTWFPSAPYTRDGLGGQNRLVTVRTCFACERR